MASRPFALLGISSPGTTRGAEHPPTSVYALLLLAAAPYAHQGSHRSRSRESAHLWERKSMSMMPSKRLLPVHATCLGALVALSLAARVAGAVIVEPDGTSVPAPTRGGQETSLQQFFDAQGEGINAAAEASPTPATFSPLCAFQATLVLSQSGSQAGLSWYNVPADATSAPAALYPIVAIGVPVGTVVSSAAIRSNPAYAGGLVGFALMKELCRNCAPTPVYYSEYQRNAFCSGCVMPDHWKMMLAYASKRTPNAYYLAFEDWEGANATSSPNDGDFNDKVFLVGGVRCAGGGEPCDTGKPGVCATGLTECQPNAGIACKQVVMPSKETCDGIDNDCMGGVDDGDICEPGYVCDHATCVGSCERGEFPCGPGLACAQGYCVDTACLAKVCAAGQACRQGACVGACDGVVCPGKQVCRYGDCVDPC